MNRETAIENAIITNPELLGFPKALAIRNVRVAWRFGRIDLMLFPPTGKVKLVLVEAKHHQSADATAKVLGQLLMYYAGALKIGAKGLRLLRKFAAEQPERALSTKWISPHAITGLRNREAAWEQIQSGEKLTPEQIKLFVAMDNAPGEALCGAISLLKEHHGLEIGVQVFCPNLDLSVLADGLTDLEDRPPPVRH